MLGEVWGISAHHYPRHPEPRPRGQKTPHFHVQTPVLHIRRVSFSTVPRLLDPPRARAPLTLPLALRMPPVRLLDAADFRSQLRVCCPALEGKPAADLLSMLKADVLTAECGSNVAKPPCVRVPPRHARAHPGMVATTACQAHESAHVSNPYYQCRRPQ